MRLRCEVGERPAQLAAVSSSGTERLEWSGDCPLPPAPAVLPRLLHAPVTSPPLPLLLHPQDLWKRSKLVALLGTQDPARTRRSVFSLKVHLTGGTLMSQGRGRSQQLQMMGLKTSNKEGVLVLRCLDKILTKAMILKMQGGEERTGRGGRTNCPGRQRSTGESMHQIKKKKKTKYFIQGFLNLILYIELQMTLK